MTAATDQGYRRCVRCVMDTTDPEIVFDAAGVCDHCHAYDVAVARHVPELGVRGQRLDELVRQISAAGKGHDYDCVIGLSGGVDSSYLAYECKRLGLRPLAVHLDNGWDSELAVKNIEHIVTKLDIDLSTYVIDWEEFRDLQLAFLRAGVVDIEMLTDHAITAALRTAARDNGVRFVLSGANVTTEAVMPRKWAHRKSDLRNMKAIAKRHGNVRIESLPTASTLQLLLDRYTRRVTMVYLLDLIDYDKPAAMETLRNELGWQYYGGKHYESVFTRFYQAYILPTKFGIDKRKAHLSSLVCAGQLTRDEALQQLEAPLYDPDALRDDKTFVCKKLGLSEPEFDAMMAEAPRSHREYPSDEWLIGRLLKLNALLRRVRGTTGAAGTAADPRPVDGQ